MSTKKMMYREVANFQLSDFSVDEMIDKLNSFKDMHPEQDLQLSYHYEYIHEGPDSIDIYYISPETDEEEQARLDYERKQVEDKERKELNRLLGYKSLNSSNQKRLEELMGKYHNG